MSSDIIAGMSSTKRIVIIADTHVGDRSKELEPALFKAIEQEQPDMIFHAGDVCKSVVIDQLETIAPTLVVQGNRDWFLGHKLPKDYQININGLEIALAHGHFSIWHWFWNYIYLFLTWRVHDNLFFQKKLAQYYPNAQVIIYGHLHYPFDEIFEGKHFLNPGVGHPEWRNNFRPGYIVLTIEPDATYSTKMKFVNPQSD